MKYAKLWSLLALSFTAAVACTETSDPGGDEPYVPPVPGSVADSGTPTTNPPVGAPDTGVPVTPRGDAGNTPVGSDASTPSNRDSGPPVSGGALDAVLGSGKNCSTYGLPANGKCGGIYCGVDEQMLTAAFAELPADRTCVVPAALVCSGINARTVSACARSVKSNPFNLGKTNEELRPLLEECVYMKEASIKAAVVPECLSCYIDSAQCSGDKCLDECLLGDSPECDKCRLDKGCSVPVAACTGFPNPL